jgi:hypothetical protein
MNIVSYTPKINTSYLINKALLAITCTSLIVALLMGALAQIAVSDSKRTEALFLESLKVYEKVAADNAVYRTQNLQLTADLGKANMQLKSALIPESTVTEAISSHVFTPAKNTFVSVSNKTSDAFSNLVKYVRE